MVGLPPRFLRATFSIHVIDLLITECRNFILGLTSLKACARSLPVRGVAPLHAPSPRLRSAAASSPRLPIGQMTFRGKTNQKKKQNNNQQMDENKAREEGSVQPR